MARGAGSSTREKINKGFTLAEVLIVIAIIGILSGIAGASAVSIYRNIKQTQLDKTAETIFHAAQDRLSELYAYGKEDSVADGLPIGTIEATKKVMYISSDAPGSNAFTSIMGDDTVSGDVFSNLWAIEYQASTCRVLNVVYADKTNSGLGGFGRGINEDTALDSMIADLKNHSFTERKNKYGWYGDEGLTDLQQADKQIGDTSADVEIINAENLYAHISVSVGWENNLTKDEVAKFLENVKVKLTIQDADSTFVGAPSKTFEIEGKALLSKGTIESDANGYYNGQSDGDDGDGYVTNKYLSASWDMLLDSLSDNSFTGSNHKKTIDGYGVGLNLGSNFYLICAVESTDGSTPSVQDYDVDNSLFAGYSASDQIAYIEYGRHLQNIGKGHISGLNAVQISDIDFNSEAAGERAADYDAYNKYWLSVYPDQGGFTDFTPLSTENLKSYDGQDHVIKNLDINNDTADETYSGIFGKLSQLESVKKVIITDSTLNSSKAAKAGMFAGLITGSSTLTIENCYLNDITINSMADSSEAATGGFAGEISSNTTVKDCAFVSVNIGTSAIAKNSGAFAGRISGAFQGTGTYVLGGRIGAESNAGSFIGSSFNTPSNLSFNECKSIGTIVSASTGNAGGFIGSADCSLTITDSAYYMPSLAESAETVCMVTPGFMKALGISYSSDEALITYGALKSHTGFKYVDDLKTSDISGMKWINAGDNAGGLVGKSSNAVIVQNSFATGVLSAYTNAGGFVGSTDGTLTVSNSYTDFYISGNNVGGFAGDCDLSSNFDSCYSAGFLVGSAENAAGFAPVAVGSITNSYTVFNFDNIFDSSIFSGTASEDDDHKLNTNGTVANYPEVTVHSYYPVAKSSSGKAYYVYSATNFKQTSNAVEVSAPELAANVNEDGETLLSGNFVMGQGKNNTVPYRLSSYLGNILKDYPFPTLKVNRTLDGSIVETVLKHYNDWLIVDKNGLYNLEVWYMMYNEDMTSLKSDVASIGRTGIKLARKTRAIAVSNDEDSEYQINVGEHKVFSGYKFVGFFDPVTASKPLVSASNVFDRTQKFDYLKNDDPSLLPSIRKSMKSGDIVVQTSIKGKNTYNYNCADHASILEESETNSYAGTKRIYAVYRYNRPYNVTLSYVEYELPSANATMETQSLEQIYNGSKIASNDVFEVIYTEPDRASHPELLADEELTEDYIAEKVLFDQYKIDGDETKYKDALSALAVKRATVNQIITRRVPDYSKVGFDLFDIDKLRQNNMISASYAQFVKNMPVYTLVRISPDTRDPDGNLLNYKDRCIEIEQNSDGRISLNTDKAYHYVILYNSNKARKVLNLVFRNTESDEDGVVPIFNSYDNLSETLAEKEFVSDNTKNYTVRVSSAGFQDKYISLDELMKAGSHPTFNGFTLNTSDSSYVHPDDGSDVVTLYYDRTKYVLAFKLNSPASDPLEKYYDSTSRNEIQDIYYGQAYQRYLWEIRESDIEVDIQGYYIEDLKNAYKIQLGYYWNRRWYFYDIANNYKELENYVRQLPGTSGEFTLQFFYESGYDNAYYANVYSWSKTDGAFGYAFNRSGYFLSGFNYYYQDNDGELSYNGKKYAYIGETTSVTTILNMPDKNVLVEPQWTVNPKNLRVEIYYQSAYDDISAVNETKEYEFYRGRTYAVNNGVATTQSRKRLPISALVASVNTGLVDFLEPYFAAGDFYKKDEHNLSGSGFNPYVSNEENSVRYGYPHDGGNDTMVVALYYDRAPVEYRFHFINSNNFYIGNYPRYYIRNQWADFIANSALSNYQGEAADHIALKAKLTEEHQTTDDYVAIGKHAKVKVTSGNHYAVSNTAIDYGGLSGNNYGVATATNSNVIMYGITVYYQALYGAPAVFSSDGTSLIPYWYCYMGGPYPVELQRYVIGGSLATGTTTYYNDYSLKYFGDVSTATASLSKDMYPYYPPAGSGSTIFYTEVAPSDDPSFGNVRTSASQNVNQNMFKLNNPDEPTISTFGKAINGQLVFWTNGAMRIFLDGYTTYAYKLEGQSSYSTNIPELAGSGVSNIYILLQRNTYTMSFVDASLKEGVNFDTSYLYKQVIPRLPNENEINSPGSDYIFDGWYTSSAYTTRIADANGNIDQEYKNLSSTLTDNSGNLLMNYENIKLFAKWAPRECNITFNPFYPDAMSYGVDSRLTISPNPILYGSTINSLPEVLRPEGSAYANRVILHENDETYYAITNTAGEAVMKFKFIGWYKYTGLNTPSNMTDLQVQFVEGTSHVTDHTVLYAKWEQVLGEALYTITCLDYTHEGEEIFIVERSGTAGESLTVTPPAYNDTRDKDVQIIKGSYDDLKNYEVISTAITKTLTNGMTFKFRYKVSSDWKYVVKNCINIGNTDIVINETEYSTSYNQVMIAAPDIEGYSIYQYQIGNEQAVTKTDTSGYIPVLKPEDETGTLVVTIRYELNDNATSVLSSDLNYYKYDPLDWVVITEGVFNWEDDTYLPAIRYVIGDVSTYEFIGNVADATISDTAIEKISEKDPGDYNAEMMLVAMNKTDSSLDKVIRPIGNATVTIARSAYSLSFTDSTDASQQGVIYYAFVGSKTGSWFWDKELKYKIGENGTSLVETDITGLTGDVSANAANVQNIIKATKDPDTGKYKPFIAVMPQELVAYTMVDENGALGNGNKLTNDTNASVVDENSNDPHAVNITLYDVSGNEIGTITVILPTDP